MEIWMINLVLTKGNGYESKCILPLYVWTNMTHSSSEKYEYIKQVMRKHWGSTKKYFDIGNRVYVYTVLELV